MGGAANSIAPIAQGIGGLVNAIRGNRGVYKAYQQANAPTPAEQEYAGLIDALTNVENPRYKSTYDTQYKQGVDAFLRQLQMITQASNRQMARGLRPQFFNPERADETINYLTTRGLPNIQAQAEQAARSRIADVARAQAGLIPSQRERQAANFALVQQKALDRQASPLGAFGDILKSLQGFGQMQQPQQTGAVFSLKMINTEDSTGTEG